MFNTSVNTLITFVKSMVLSPIPYLSASFQLFLTPVWCQSDQLHQVGALVGADIGRLGWLWERASSQGG